MSLLRPWRIVAGGAADLWCEGVQSSNRLVDLQAEAIATT
jgi:hypothetical protein